MQADSCELSVARERSPAYILRGALVQLLRSGTYLKAEHNPSESQVQESGAGGRRVQWRGSSRYHGGGGSDRAGPRRALLVAGLASSAPAACSCLL